MYLSIYLYLIYLCVKNRKNRMRTRERNLSLLAGVLHCSMSTGWGPLVTSNSIPVIILESTSS